MPLELNATHDPARRSWVESANSAETDFPIQNLPFGVFDDGKGARGGVALGDSIIDLGVLMAGGLIEGEAAKAGSGDTLLPLFAQPRTAVSALRARLSELYREGGSADRAAAGALEIWPVPYSNPSHLSRVGALPGRGRFPGDKGGRAADAGRGGGARRLAAGSPLAQGRRMWGRVRRRRKPRLIQFPLTPAKAGIPSIGGRGS